MLSVDQVLEIIGKVVLPQTAKEEDLGRGFGSVLAQDILLDEDSPRFDRSQLDGYAVRSADAVAGAQLALAGQVDAGGRTFSGVVNKGECIGINTGGVVPAGADAILMVEHSEIFHTPGDPSRKIIIHVKQTVKAGYGIHKRGADARAGTVILQAGTRLGPAQLALCAAAGVARPRVRLVRAAVLSTGDELVPLQTPLPLPEGKIRNSNQVMLGALARESGADVMDLGTCPDEEKMMRAALAQGLAEADLLVVCGGMSMGTRDLVPGLLKDLGVAMHVEKVRIKPGKPFVLGTLGDGPARKYVAGLPGNPVSAFVTFQRFVRAMIRRMEGSSEGPRLVPARLDRALGENGDREFYQPCRLHSGPGGMTAELLAWKGSADIFTLGKADGMVIQAAGAAAMAAGTKVDVLTW